MSRRIFLYLNVVFGFKKKWLHISSDSLYGFAEGKTPTSGVTWVEKCCCLLLIMLYNKACILVKNERRREAKKEQQKRQITRGCVYYHPEVSRDGC